MKDLTGQRFGRLVVEEKVDKRQNHRLVWKCKCDCGNEVEIMSSNLTSGNSKSCGCLNKELSGERMKKHNNKQDFIDKRQKAKLDVIIKNMEGKRFGMLVAIKPTEKRKYNGSVVWEFKCDCGNTCFKALNQILHDNPNCGCMTEEKHRNIGYKSIEQLNSECVFDTNIKMLRSDKARKDSSSGIRGVQWAKWANSWRASISFKKKTYRLGYFKDIEDAIKARKKAEEMMYEPFLEWYEAQKKLNG